VRSPKVLEKMVDGLKNMTVDLLALDTEEEAWFKARIKGRHGMSGVGIHRGEPGDELPLRGLFPDMGDSIPVNPGISKKKPQPSNLTEDGY
jgi:hypothetical protein